jgi:hypothetical protein
VIAEAALLVARGFLQVAPVAASTYFVSHDRPALAVGVGFWISFVWWMNAGSASTLTGPAWAAVYACGAAGGTYCGQWAAQRLSTRKNRKSPQPGSGMGRNGIRQPRSITEP